MGAAGQHSGITFGNCPPEINLSESLSRPAIINKSQNSNSKNVNSRQNMNNYSPSVYLPLQQQVHMNESELDNIEQEREQYDDTPLMDPPESSHEYLVHQPSNEFLKQKSHAKTLSQTSGVRNNNTLFALSASLPSQNQLHQFMENQS